ncbi:hypothetical protein EDC19_2352 [Natranaerovirga hydrolytica]|uniref:Uncharacterized protein n=1 Tax=Natranaerovirga hydrolytica TaxID=680378 RepID=A0A4R1ML79_9FIRM|nr:hypothetical protein [Natranaerovirga hydrolytica]TCK90583.1 hypothetical protein EDC19_2352 [Natranaerovirga hydrolytica]
MLNEEKIKLMTKLAIYEKNIGYKDFEVNEYFKHDYILKNNLKTRIFVTLACAMLFGGHALLEIFVFLEERQSIDFIRYGLTYGALYLVIIICYSILSTKIYATEYKETQLRLSGYKKVLKKLNQFSEESH